MIVAYRRKKLRSLFIFYASVRGLTSGVVPPGTVFDLTQSSLHTLLYQDSSSKKRIAARMNTLRPGTAERAARNREPEKMPACMRHMQKGKKVLVNSTGDAPFRPCLLHRSVQLRHAVRIRSHRALLYPASAPWHSCRPRRRRRLRAPCTFTGNAACDIDRHAGGRSAFFPRNRPDQARLQIPCSQSVGSGCNGGKAGCFYTGIVFAGCASPMASGIF